MKRHWVYIDVERGENNKGKKKWGQVNQGRKIETGRGKMGKLKNVVITTNFCGGKGDSSRTGPIRGPLTASKDTAFLWMWCSDSSGRSGISSFTPFSLM